MILSLESKFSFIQRFRCCRVVCADPEMITHEVTFDDTLLVQVREGDSLKKLNITASIEIPMLLKNRAARYHFTPIILVVAVLSMTS